MNRTDWVIWVCFFAFSSIALWQVPRIWRDPHGGGGRDPLSRAHHRCIPLGTAGLFVVACLAPVVRAATPRGETAPAWAAVLFGAVFVPLMLALATVALLNRPKVLVAPGHRDDRGLLSALRASRSSRRHD